MSDFLERISHFSPKRLALLADELQSRVQALEDAAHEPVAIVGIGCRLPGGANTPEQFWELLRNGVDAVSEVPPERWDAAALYDPDPDAPGKIASKWGGFLGPVDGFDPHFFGISPREAHSMDPQQRLLLEVAWEALEHAGIAPERVAGSRTGVFVGMSAGDYYGLLRQNGPESFDAYTASGIAHSIASGRLSYLLGVHGPSVSIDTACSSSLVAIHQAVHSLRRGECGMALAGGVNLILSPEVTIALSRSHMMAPDGRCKAFDSRADGFVRGEGCGVLVLKRLSQAQADGDRVIAVIRGSAANQDGRSNGLTAPNGPAQEAVLREALADARVAAKDIGFVEAHGTGTSLGDPIEVQALGRVMGEGRAAGDALWLGSVKASVGHLEAAAGVTAVIKMAMALQHGEVPAQLHLQQPNPFIPWNELPIRLPRQHSTWVRPAQGRRLGGVSSFGFSGTNVHMVFEEAPEPDLRAVAVERPLHLLAVSGRQDAVSRQLLASHRAWLTDHAHQPHALADLAFTANSGRSHFAQRVAVLAASPAEAASRIDAYLAGEEVAGVMQGTAGTRAPKIAFLFTGQGSQYAGMAQRLYDTQLVFRQVLDECEEALRPRLQQSLLSVLYAPADSASAIDDTAYTQPALFAVELALARLWMSWGIRPSVVMGHSVGEFVAACVAGVFSLQDGVALIAERGRLMSALPRDGAMVSVAADEARVAAAVAPWQQEVSVAAVNGPASVVISGRAAVVDAIAAALQSEGLKTTRLKVSHAFHSPLLQPMLEPLAAFAATLSLKPPQIDLVSNLTGDLAGAEVATPAYWRDHARAPVQFAKAMAALGRTGCTAFLEVGPHPTLLSMGQACLPEHTGLWLPSLRRGRDDWEQMLDSLAQLYVNGAPVDWAGFDAPYARRRQVLATYPFQRERHWAETRPTTAVARPPAHELLHPLLHPLLGSELLQSASDDRLFEVQIGPGTHAYLADHQILRATLLPSPVYMEMAVAAAAQQWGEGPVQIDDLVVHQALALSDEAPTRLQLVLAPPREGVSGVRIHAYDAEARQWRLQASASVSLLRVSEQAVQESEAPSALAALQQRIATPQPVPAYYDWLASLGLSFGPRFRGVAQICRREGETLARMAWPAELDARDAGYRLHPALLDACFHVVGAALPGGGSTLGDAFLLLNVERLRVLAPLPRGFWTHVTVHADDVQGLATRETFRAHLRLIGDDGQLLAEFTGLHFKRARAEALRGNALPHRVRSMLHEIAWRPAASSEGGLPSPERLHEQLALRIEALASRNGLDRYAHFVPGLDALTRSYIVRALRELGLDFAPGVHFSAEALMTPAGVLPRHRRLFNRMLEILAEDGVLAAEAVATGSQWRVLATPPADDADASAAALLAQHPDCDAEVNLTRRCARELAAVLRGEADPLALLFPGGSLAETERLYQHSPPAKTYNQLIGEVFAALVPAAPTGRPLRVLEIGAGTGSTTHHVLPHLQGLPAGRVEYTFTDVSPLFLTRAREKFRGSAFMRYELLDIGRAPVEQSFPIAHYDVIVGANVLHATADLGVTLTHVRQLLAPGGTLVLLEGTTPQRFGDLTVGLLEGWWAYTDEQRRRYALMAREGWLSLMAEVGFAQARAIPGTTDHPVLRQQAVFVAQVPAERPARVPQRWLLLPDAGGVAEAAAALLRAQGDEAELLKAEPLAKGDSLSSRLSSRLAAQLSTQPSTQGSNQGSTQGSKGLPAAWDGVLNLQPLDVALDEHSTAQDLAQGQERLVRHTLDLVHTLTAQAAPPRLWMVTRGAQATRAGEPVNPAQATAWGMSHVIAIEHPELRCVRLDLDPVADAATLARSLVASLLAALAGAQGGHMPVSSFEDQIAVRGGQRLVRRLVPWQATPERAALQPLALKPDRSYLVTGGLRGLGLRVAQWLVEQGARHLVLMGRQGPDARAQAVIDRLAAQGVRVLAQAGDVSQRADVERVLAEAARALPPLAGVIHSAGALDDGVLASQTWPRFASVMAAKVLGSWNLHTLAGPLDFLVLFSSGASVAGNPGQANHAAANSFEDMLAWYRQSRGLPTVSINWGPWAEIGAAADRQLASPGFLQAIAPADGLAALAFAMRADARGLFQPAQLAVLASDWSHLRDAGASPLFQKLLAQVARQPAAPKASQHSSEKAAPVTAAPEGLRERLAAAAPNRRRSVLRDQVRQLTVKVLGVARPDELDVNEPLMQLGLDSLMAVELRNLLGKAVGRTLPATVTFDHPSVAALTDHLAAAVFADLLSEPTAPPDATPTTPTPAAAADALAELTEDELALQLMKRLDGMSSGGTL